MLDEAPTPTTPAPTTPPPAWPPLVRFTHSCRFPYSSILPPPTVNTIASLKPCLLCPKLAPVPGPLLPSPPGIPPPPPLLDEDEAGPPIVPLACAFLGSKSR